MALLDTGLIFVDEDVEAEDQLLEVRPVVFMAVRDGCSGSVAA
jgi:hypothetical protein